MIPGIPSDSLDKEKRSLAILRQRIRERPAAPLSWSRHDAPSWVESARLLVQAKHEVADLLAYAYGQPATKARMRMRVLAAHFEFRLGLFRRRLEEIPDFPEFGLFHYWTVHAGFYMLIPPADADRWSEPPPMNRQTSALFLRKLEVAETHLASAASILPTDSFPFTGPGWNPAVFALSARITLRQIQDELSPVERIGPLDEHFWS